MKIKAQGLLNASEWIRRHHGDDTLSAILQRCSPAVRERFITAIAIEWHDASEFEEFLAAAEQVVGVPTPGTLAKTLGAAGAEANMSGFMRRAAFYIARPEYAVKRVASTWRQFNDEGSMTFTDFSETGTMVEVHDLVPPGPLFCEALTGWCEVLADRVGASSPRAAHVQCRLRGDPVCAWRLRWGEWDEGGDTHLL